MHRHTLVLSTREEEEEEEEDDEELSYLTEGSSCHVTHSNCLQSFFSSLVGSVLNLEDETTSTTLPSSSVVTTT